MGALTDLFNSLKEIVVSNIVGIVIGFGMCTFLNKPRNASGGQSTGQRPGMGGPGMGGPGMGQRPGGPPFGGGGFR